MADKDAPRDWVRNRYAEGYEQTRDACRNYWLNTSFLLGYQWLTFNRVSSRIEPIPEDVDRIQATMNRMRTNVRAIISTFTQRELSFEVLPTAGDDAAQAAAKLGEAILEETRRLQDWEVKREAFGYTVLKGGTGAICVEWDPATQYPVANVLAIPEFVVEPGTRDPERARWWIKLQLLPPAEVKAMFPEAFKLRDPAADANTGTTQFSRRLMKEHQQTDVPLTAVYTYYERPNPLCEDGRMLVEVNGEIVQYGKWEFPWRDRLNLSVGRETLIETLWYGDTILNDCRPVQVALNLAWSNLLEHLRSVANTRIAVPASAIHMLDQLGDVPGEVMVYPDGSAPPGFIPPPQIPGWVREMPTQLANQLDDLLHVHDVSRGIAPANIESGYGISILAEKDASPIGRLIKETARVFSAVGSMYLQLIEQECRTERESTVYMNSGPQHLKWKGSDLMGQTEAHVPLDAILPRSRAALQAFADKALEMGLIEDVVQYARVAELPGHKELLTVVNQPVAKAIRENHKMALSEVVLPATFDPHDVHIKVHNEFRMSERYEQMSEAEQRTVDEHVKAHEVMAAEEAGRAETQKALSPALAATPNADGPLPPEVMAALMADGGVPPSGAPAETTPLPTAEEMIDPGLMTDQIINDIRALAPGM